MIISPVRKGRYFYLYDLTLQLEKHLPILLSGTPDVTE